MTVSDTTVEKELSLLSDIAPEISRKTLMRNAVNAAFLSDNEREELMRRMSSL